MYEMNIENFRVQFQNGELNVEKKRNLLKLILNEERGSDIAMSREKDKKIQQGFYNIDIRENINKFYITEEKEENLINLRWLLNILYFHNESTLTLKGDQEKRETMKIIGSLNNQELIDFQKKITKRENKELKALIIRQELENSEEDVEMELTKLKHRIRVPLPKNLNIFPTVGFASARQIIHMFSSGSETGVVYDKKGSYCVFEVDEQIELSEKKLIRKMHSFFNQLNQDSAYDIDSTKLRFNQMLHEFLLETKMEHQESLSNKTKKVLNKVKI